MDTAWPEVEVRGNNEQRRCQRGMERPHLAGGSRASRRPL